METIRNISFIGLFGSIAIYHGSKSLRSIHNACRNNVMTNNERKLQNNLKGLEEITYEIGKTMGLIYLVTSFFSLNINIVISTDDNIAVSSPKLGNITMDHNGIIIQKSK